MPTLYDRGTPWAGSLSVPGSLPYTYTLARPVLKGTMLIAGFTEVEQDPGEDQYSINYAVDGLTITFSSENAGASLSFSYQDNGSEIKASDVVVDLARLQADVNLAAGASQIVNHTLGKINLLTSIYKRINGAYYAIYGFYRWFLSPSETEYRIESLTNTSFRITNLLGTAETFHIEAL